MKRSSLSLACAVSLGSILAAFASPALAQSDCTCVLPAGAVGSISSANPDVFVTGATGREVAVAGTPLSSGSVVSVGPNGSAGIDLGPSCRFAMSASMSMQIVPQDGGQCVQVIEDTVASGGLDGTLAGAAVIAAGAGVVISLGLLQSVSK